MIPGEPNSKSYSLSILIMSSFKLLLHFRMTFSSIFAVRTISSLQHHSTFPKLLGPSHSNSNNCHSPLPFHLRSIGVYMRSLLLESIVAQGKKVSRNNLPFLGGSGYRKACLGQNKVWGIFISPSPTWKAYLATTHISSIRIFSSRHRNFHFQQRPAVLVLLESWPKH